MTSVDATSAVVGPAVDRVDGPAKVTGAAPYPSDYRYPGLAHASLVRSTISVGRVRTVRTAAAEAAPGVLAVITSQTAPRLQRARRNVMTPPPDPPLQSDEVHHYGQYVAVVVAETPQQATAAARLVRVEYEPGAAALSNEDPGARTRSNPYHVDMSRGDVEQGLRSAHVTIEATYTTSEQVHTPVGLFATVAHWDSGHLTVHDSTQNPFHVRDVLAAAFRLSTDDVRVEVPFVGGAFGAGLRVSPHTILAALAARVVGRPVKLVLTRPQMFTGIGHRPGTVHRVRVGATRDGTLSAIDHEGTATGSRGLNILNPVTTGTIAAYACPNVSTRDKRVELDIPPISHMRAPGEAEGNFALESALDELAYALGLDPVELRLRNHADVHPQTGAAWSTKALRTCYRVGAERFGWSRRDPAVGSMRDRRWLVGYGMAGVTYGHFQEDCRARATIRRDGTARVDSGATEIGVGTQTVITQVAAEALGLPIEKVELALGDTSLPRAPFVGGSGLTAALGSAVLDACHNLVQRCAHWADREGMGYAEVLGAAGLDELSADGESSRPAEDIGVQVKSLIMSRHAPVARKVVSLSKGTVPAGAFAARFVEVAVDPDLGLLRVRRVVSAIDAGRVLNGKTARSQIIGGSIQGIGTALFEGLITDPGTGRIANATLGDYLIPVNADVPDMDVVFVGEPDPTNPLGVKGVGEIGYMGIPAAIANAVFHATGRRIRSLPITIDQLL